MTIQDFGQLDAVVESILHAARIPGAGLAIVEGGRTILARGYGYRNLEAKLPLTARTVYPIASTTKAINATLLGMLVDEGKLAWDEPVQSYLPHFRWRDPLVGVQVTLRDLITMRTGLPRHDWVAEENPVSRADIVSRLQYLESSAGFRERFQYNNLTVTAAGHVAEVVTGRTWEELVMERILRPLGMNSTSFTLPRTDDVTLSYHESSRRELVLTRRFACEVTAPSGGAIHSTVEDMAKWLVFNLNDGRVGEHQLIKAETLAAIHSPQVAGTELSGPTPNAPYAMGWYVDTYQGRARLSHGGYLHDVNSEAMIFPKHGVGIVAFINFGPPVLARLIGQRAFDLLAGLPLVETLESRLEQYEKRVDATRESNATTRRVPGTSPSHALDDYVGRYSHPAYGSIDIHLDAAGLVFKRGALILPLMHWHYDAWIARDLDLFPIHLPNALDTRSRLLFETNADGDTCALLIPFEPAVAPIRFLRDARTP